MGLYVCDRPCFTLGKRFEKGETVEFFEGTRVPHHFTEIKPKEQQAAEQSADDGPTKKQIIELLEAKGATSFNPKARKEDLLALLNTL